MSRGFDKIGLLRKMAEDLGLDASDVLAVGQAMRSDEPTLRAALPGVLERAPARLADGHGADRRRLLDGLPGSPEHDLPAVPGLGDRLVSQIGQDDLVRLRDAIRLHVGHDEVDRLRRRSQDPDAHGFGAARNFVAAARMVFRTLVLLKLRSDDPSWGLKALPTPHKLRRPLLQHEVAAIHQAACVRARDPELVDQLLWFLRSTGARLEAAQNLTLAMLQPFQPQIVLSEKNGVEHAIPQSWTRLRELEAFARSRGATEPCDLVFRRRDGGEVTARVMNTIWEHVHEQLPWAASLGVSTHWFRYTLLDPIATEFGVKVAADWAGHKLSYGGATAGYLGRTPFSTLCEVHERLIGPLE